MSLLEQLGNENCWKQFQQYKSEHGQLSRREEKQLADFIAGKRYLPITEKMEFGYPEKKLITKSSSGKKRTVYCYSRDETWVLKLLAWLLYEYDDCLSDNLYSFRRNITAKTAFQKIRKMVDIDERYILKLDIHDYFNSINTEILIREMKEIISDDEQLLEFLCRLLRQDRCYWQNELIEENRGAMAGVPLASFFANIYLRKLDEMFVSMNIPYFRYSDDIIVFCESQSELEKCSEMISEHLREYELTLNMDKYQEYQPHQGFVFLGLKYKDGVIDIADATVRKMQDKIRRKARSIYRSGKKNDISYEASAEKLIRSIDYKLYDINGEGNFTWSRFYFPLINTAEGLHKIDQTMLQYLRYLYSGRHYRGNYVITYEKLKSLGYTSVVNEYYRWQKENRDTFI